jgi:thioredoxin-related protein
MKLKYKVIFIIWFLIISLPMISMMGNHFIVLRASKSESLLKLSEHNKYLILHFLGSDCACSESVYKKLALRSPLINRNEKIFIVGKNQKWESTLKKKGFNVETHPMDYFDNRYEIKAVPQLVIFDKGKLAYSGGYTSSRSSKTDVDDEKIISEVLDKKLINERPIFGCISGSVNRKNVDPLNLKYN